jgi:hypothetical protein
MRSRSRLLLGGLALASLLGACQPAAPPVAEKPKRHSFEDSNNWQPSSNAASASSSASTQQQAQQVQQTWDKARATNDEAERQRLANEALNQTRQMAEPAASPHSP